MSIANKSRSRKKQGHNASARINLRVQAQIKRKILQAARLQRVKLTEFMISSSQSAAESVLAERTRFVLSPDKWREFNAALDSPPREIPALRRLFSKPSVFDAE
ncbi:MAG TPA: DUF1778 domain-containing protein [Verrucomicrobiae bacterium]|nr:DUF1778 domain-containing protein [Verrucomicrobiae bacterium]